jgi:hypothetical protein
MLNLRCFKVLLPFYGVFSFPTFLNPPELATLIKYIKCELLTKLIS